MADMKDGIYFGLPEDEYHAIPRLSSSGVQNMLCSPATFWARSWMNPHREDDDTAARRIGSAYHCARFEPDQFPLRYVRALEKDDFPEALTTDTEIKAALADMGQTQAMKGEGVADRAHRLRDLGYQGPIWHVELAAWEAAKGDRVAIPAKTWDEIARDADRLRQMPEVAEHLQGGQAEVTILWTCPESDLPLKARLDYLKPLSFTDFKTFDNAMGRHLEHAITAAFRFNRYYVQGAFYWQAVEAIRKGLVEVQGELTPDNIALIRAVQANPRPARCFYVFQEKRGVPNILVREYGIFGLHVATVAAAPDDDAAGDLAVKLQDFSALYRKAEAEIWYAKRAFRSHMEAFGSSPWFPMKAMGRITDEDFPINWLESDF